MQALQRIGLWEAMLSATLQALIAQAMGISPVEASSILGRAKHGTAAR
jgi:hypothetical protein